MSLFLGLVAAMGVVVGMLWRLHMAATAVRDVAEVAGDISGLSRRWWWQRKFARDRLDLVEDPRTAAVAMMVATAEADGAMTERERSAIVDGCIDTFGASPEQADQLFAHARWLTREVRDLDRCFKRLRPILHKVCSREEKRDVIRLVRLVAEADGSRDTIVIDAIARLNRDLMA